MNSTHIEDWRERFNVLFPQREIPDAIEGYWGRVPDPKHIKAFISQLLAEQREQVLDALLPKDSHIHCVDVSLIRSLKDTTHSREV